MKATEAFEIRREQLADELKEAKDAGQAAACAVMTMEQIACELAQQEQDERRRQRQQAVMSIAKQMPTILQTARAEGELVVGPAQEAKQDERQKRMRMAGIGGAVLLAALAIYEIIEGRAAFALFQAAGASLLFWSGMQRRPEERKMEARGVQRFDAKEMIAQLARICQAVDICTEDLALLEREGQTARISGNVDDATLDLLCALMEAKTTGSQTAAVRSLAQAEQYLHLLGMEVMLYAPEQADYFDILPTIGESRTVRPAIMKDGRLLRRGVAACKAERSASA